MIFTWSHSFFYAQNAVSDSIQNPKTEQKDIRDVFHQILRSKKKERDENRFYWSVVPAAGYTLQTGFAGVVSANIGFYDSKLPEQKISTISASATYSEYRQILAPLYVNIWSMNNKINFISDFKYLDYPSEIYGLGGKRIPVSQNSNEAFTVDYKAVKLHQSAMFGILKNFYAGGGIFYDQFWNIKVSDSLGRQVRYLLNRNLGDSERAVGLGIRALYDSRLNQITPENGLYATVLYRPNFDFLGSHNNWSSMQFEARKYFRFPENSHNILAFWGFAWVTTSKNDPPYLLLPSTSWDDQYNTGRGYIQSRFRGRNMFYYENEYRFRLTRNGLLGGVVFANAQTFSGDLSSEYKKIYIGYGTGIRIKLNKKSNTNLAIDYGFGQDGSKGFFVNLGEVF